MAATRSSGPCPICGLLICGCRGSTRVTAGGSSVWDAEQRARAYLHARGWHCEQLEPPRQSRAKFGMLGWHAYIFTMRIWLDDSAG